MAIDILYDNGVPESEVPGLIITGDRGVLLTYSETSGIATITYNFDIGPTFIPASGDVAIVYNAADLTEFAVFYVTFGRSLPMTEYNSSITATIDKNFYNFSKRTGQSYIVQLYSTRLYSDLISDFANTFKVSTQTEKSHYSDLMIAYSKKTSHTVILDNLRRNFWSGKDALMADVIFLIDSCTNGSPKAYKVSINDATFEVFNNKFKSTVSFNLASSKL
jgi:hypothetical protein